MKQITRSSSHSVKFANTGKQARLSEFLTEYDRVIWCLVDYIWNTKITWGTKTLDIQNNKLVCPNFISTKNIPIKTNLSARALKLASGEALGIISSQISKRRKQIYILKQKMREGDIIGIKKLQSKIDSHPLVQPSKTRTNQFANLDSNCCKFIPGKTAEFDGYLKLYALGKAYGHIYLPIKFTRHSNKFQLADFALMTSWQIGSDQVCSRWQKDIAESNGDKILGADQGYTTCLSLSDGQFTPVCLHGHDLASIIKKMTRQKKGSKAFGKSQEHRTNYINWSINQLDLSNVKELRLEKLFQMRKGQCVGSNLARWTYTSINTQIISKCSLLGVRVIEQAASYRSQRCSGCGWVHKSNRKRKEFVCTSCGLCLDADINGALNHEADLYRLPVGFWQTKLNRIGFYWLETGLVDSSGQAFTVPDEYKIDAITKTL